MRRSTRRALGLLLCAVVLVRVRRAWAALPDKTVVSVATDDLAVRRLDATGEEVPDITAKPPPSGRASRKTHRFHGHFLSLVEMATSIATVLALILTYFALRDAVEQNRLARDQLTLAKASVQPGFVVRYIDKDGQQCGDECAPNQIHVTVSGAAENVRYSATDRIIFFSVTSDLGFHYKVSPDLRRWRGGSGGDVLVPESNYLLPDDLDATDRQISGVWVGVIYYLYVYYDDIYGENHTRLFVYSELTGGSRVLNEQESLHCIAILGSIDFPHDPDAMHYFHIMISKDYKVQDLAIDAREIGESDVSLCA